MKNENKDINETRHCQKNKKINKKCKNKNLAISSSVSSGLRKERDFSFIRSLSWIRHFQFYYFYIEFAFLWYKNPLIISKIKK